VALGGGTPESIENFIPLPGDDDVVSSIDDAISIYNEAKEAGYLDGR
jgi:hypothetical protein